MYNRILLINCGTCLYSFYSFKIFQMPKKGGRKVGRLLTFFSAKPNKFG